MSQTNRSLFVPYATFVNGVPFVSFKYPDDEKYQSYVVEPELQDPAYSEESVELPELVESIDIPEYYLSDGPSFEDEEIMNRQIQAQNAMKNINYEEMADKELKGVLDDLQNEVCKMLDSPLEKSDFCSNITEVNMHKVFGNMTNSEKKELEEEAIKTVMETMVMDQEDPNYRNVFGNKVKEWLTRWTNEKSKVIDDKLQRIRDQRITDEEQAEQEAEQETETEAEQEEQL